MRSPHGIEALPYRDLLSSSKGPPNPSVDGEIEGSNGEVWSSAQGNVVYRAYG